MREYVGHGIGKKLHEEPEVPNFGRKGEGIKLKKGMTIAIEPMITQDSPAVRVAHDGWTVAAISGKVCVHFEHTIAVGKRRGCILTN